MRTENIIGKHLVGVRIGKEQEFLVFDTKSKANECVKELLKKYPFENNPELEIIQTTRKNMITVTNRNSKNDVNGNRI